MKGNINTDKLLTVDQIIKNNTPRTVELENKIARTMSIPKHMARRYFNRSCDICEIQLSAVEISMFLITQGRYDRHMHDRRKYLCKKHLADFMNISEDEYDAIIAKNIKGGCDYF